MKAVKILIVNLITAMRGASIFFLAYLLSIHYLAALGLVAVFALSDKVDGWLAGYWNAQTKFGAFFDPFVDKVFYLGGLFLLTSLVQPLGEIFRQTFWPEFSLVIIRIPPLDKKLGIQPPATQYGKFKMGCQSFALIEILLGLLLRRPDIITTGIYIAWGCIFLSFLSFYSHFEDPLKTA